MPREVIMPALGMAQETGLIVAWLKKPGEAVKAGEPLMEVETDKATMEVEAAADGWLTGVRAGEGDNVPVGDVVAVISESEDDDDDAPSDTKETPTLAPAPGPQAQPTGREVIMPALGMAQDSGKIVAWLKEPGAEISQGDALLEVETDKATLEVEADTAGYLAAVYAADGDDVPVGQVIAVISAKRPDAPVVGGKAPGKPAKADAPTSAQPEAPDRPAAPKAPEAQPAAAAKAKQPLQGDGRILASPKVRRLAAERGLDLAHLADAGHPQPYHVADLDALAALPAAQAPAPTATPTVHRIEAHLSRDGFERFTGWLAEIDQATPTAAVLAALATGALRAATEADRIAIRLDRPGHAVETFVDADLARPAGDRTGAPDPSLILRDLTGSRLTALDLGPQSAPVLTVAASGPDHLVALDYSPGAIDPDTAVALVDGFAARLEDPLQQLF